MMRFLPIAVLLCVPTAGPVPEAAPDVIVLKSGQRLSGTILDLEHEGPAILVHDAALGTVRLDTTRVRAVLPGGVASGIFAPEETGLRPEPPPESYVRLEKPTKERGGALQTGVSRWRHEATGTTLFLVGAVHIAEPAYFRRLQRILDASDVVLFEGVGRAPDGREIGQEDLERLDALQSLQLQLGGILGLGFQKDGIDYRRDFWRNADMDFGALTDAMRDRKVSLPTDNRFFRSLMKLALGLLNPKGEDAGPEEQRRLRRQLAGVLAMSDRLLARMGRLREVLIDLRNGRAMEVLRDEMGRGPGGRWLSLFYGGAHLPDFNARLAAGGWTCVGSAWLPAWTL